MNKIWILFSYDDGPVSAHTSYESAVGSAKEVCYYADVEQDDWEVYFQAVEVTYFV